MDKDLNVNVNVGGKDDLTPSLEKQKKLIEDLAAAEANLTKLRKDYGAGGAELILADLRQQLAAERALTEEVRRRTVLGGPRPPGPPGPGAAPGGGSGALMGADADAAPRAGRPSARLGPPPAPLAEPPGLATVLREGMGAPRPPGVRGPVVGGGAAAPPPPLPAAGYSDAVLLAKAEVRVREELVEGLRAAKDKEIRERAYIAVTGKASPEAEAERRAAARTAEVAVRTVAGAAPTLAHQAIMLGRPSENPMAGVGRAGALLSTIGGVLPGPIGAAVSALGALGQVAGILGEEFRGARASLAEMTLTMREQQSLLSGTRRGDVPTTESLYAAFAGHTGLMRRLNEPGLSREQRVQRLATATFEAQAEAMELNSQPLGETRGRMEAYLFSIRDRARRGHGTGFAREEFETRFGAATPGGVGLNDRPAELEQLYATATARNLTDQQLRQMAQVMTTGRLERALARTEMGRNILQSGIMPDLRPGAPQLADLPNLFRSQQKDFLSLHEDVQREVVRDQREEQRFQQTYQLWERIVRRLEANSFNPLPLGGWPDPPSW